MPEKHWRFFAMLLQKSNRQVSPACCLMTNVDHRNGLFRVVIIAVIVIAIA